MADGGVVFEFKAVNNPSVTARRDSSLYTREPFVCPASVKKVDGLPLWGMVSRHCATDLRLWRNVARKSVEFAVGERRALTIERVLLSQ